MKYSDKIDTHKKIKALSLSQCFSYSPDARRKLCAKSDKNRECPSSC